MGFLGSVLNKLKRVSNQVDNYQTAVTFAEAGISQQANQILAKKCQEHNKENLVVTSHNNRFSEEVIDYALEMAKRMEYRIVAVNAADFIHRSIDIFHSARDTLCEDFISSAGANAKPFMAKAEREGLEFVHLVKLTDIDDALAEIREECGEIAFVISENQETSRNSQRIENRQKIAQRLCVYSIT